MADQRPQKRTQRRAKPLIDSYAPIRSLKQTPRPNAPRPQLFARSPHQCYRCHDEHSRRQRLQDTHDLVKPSKHDDDMTLFDEEGMSK